MVINKIESEKEYVAFLRAHPNDLQTLFDDLMIGVTSFFREPKTFEALKTPGLDKTEVLRLRGIIAVCKEDWKTNLDIFE
jgi:chemotaxis methyl-accepting protein methylase